ncbi:hypothetical protein ACWGI1_00070 [Streptomyces sp. NPDC054835]|uniref:hypothetical protein n=1 Tax=Streptomyces exfoliatus TaxID=1905 RepID=UPI000464B578|nr:hypothetical protein [Streptomyces exfoliatus]
MADPYTASREAGERIEALYGRPLAELADGAEPGTMRYALLCSFEALRLADHGVLHHAEALNRRTVPGRAVAAEDATHILDAARRLAQAVSVRDAHAQVIGNVLQSLHRAPLPGPSTPSTASESALPEPATSLLPAAAPSAARSR